MQLLQSLRESNPNQKYIDEIIETIYKIAISYLCMNYKKVHKIVTSGGLTIEDIAIDSIAPMLLKNNEGYFYVLKDSFEQWQPKPIIEEDAIYFLNKVVAKRVEQHLVLLLKEANPFFSKILDSIYYLMKKNGLKKKNYLGLNYIVENEAVEITGEIIDEIGFNNLPFNLFANKKEMLNNILEHLKNETGYFPAIPINILTHRLEKISADDYSTFHETSHFKDRYDIEELLKNSLTQTGNKLNETYISKGKLSSHEGKLIKAALKDICEDLKQGGINSSLFDYLQQHMTNLTKNEYMLQYNHIIQYLFKVMKSSISHRLNP